MRVTLIPLGRLRTSLEHLRSQVGSCHFHLQQLPIRVVRSVVEVRDFEVVDGFKRLRWAAENGVKKIEAVIEDAVGPEAKVLMIRANASQKTLRPLDEARVIVSLIEQDGFSIAKASRLLRRGRPWASKRYALLKRLAMPLLKPVDEGRLALSVAHALTVLGRQEQLDLARVSMAAGLSANDSLTLISTYRALSDESERRALLKDPIGALQEFRQKSNLNSPILSPSACRIRERYHRLRELLDDFVDEDAAAFSPGEARLLEAERQTLAARIISCARLLSRSIAEPSKNSSQGEKI